MLGLIGKKGMNQGKMTSKPMISEPIKCPKCRSGHTVKHGYNVTLKGKFPRRKCQHCGTTFYEKKEEQDGKEVV